MTKTSAQTTGLTKFVVPALVVIAAAVGAFATYSIAHANITSQLDLGSQGEDVSELQTYLAKSLALYPSGLVTGYFGAMTQSGTQKFQISQGLVSEGTPETTGFGRVGPVTMARLNSLMGGVYIPSPTSGDRNAPWMYPETVSVGENEAVISWVTNESAVGRVMYSTSFPFLYASAQSVTSIGYGATAKIVLTDLKANTTYYYVRESIDKAGNVMWTHNETFKTE